MILVIRQVMIKKETTKQSVSVSKNDNTVTVDNMKITLENSDVSKVSDEKDSNKKSLQL